MGKTDTKRHRVLLNPKMGISMERLADRIVSLKCVQDMVLETKGKGYMVQLKFFPGYEPKDVCGYLSTRINRDFVSVVKA